MAAKLWSVLSARMTEHYRTQVEQLYAALQNDSQGQRAIAAEQIRLLMKEIVLTPEHDELQIDVRDDLAGILAISLERKKPALGRANRNLRWLRGEDLYPRSTR